MSRRTPAQSDSPEHQQEAEEDKDIHLDQEEPQSQGSGEDLQQMAQRDYQPRPQLDVYQNRGIDQQEYPVDPQARRRAQEVIQQRIARERMHAIRGRYPHALSMIPEQQQIDNEFLRYQRRRREVYNDEGQDIEQEQQKFQKFMDFQENRGKLHILIKDQLTRRFIRRYFKKFLKNFKREGRFIYQDAIHDMCMNNSQSLVINFKDLQDFYTTLGVWICQQPLHIFPELNRTLFDLCKRLYIGYQDIHKQVFVRFTSIPFIQSIKNLGHKQIGKFIQTSGVVTRRSQVFSELREAYFMCSKCGEVTEPYLFNQINPPKPQICTHCQSRGPFKITQSLSIYRNHQKLYVQESPTAMQPGRVPRQKEVILLGDNVDKVKAGDEVQLTGVYISTYSPYLNATMKYPVFSTQIQCNYIKETSMIKEYQSISLDRIRKISRMPKLVDKLMEAIFPSIYGHRYTKFALLLAMFGGVEVVYPEHRIRGDINVLMVGDPGTAKSQLLKSIHAVAPRVVYTTGKGASAVGLTATVKKQYVTQEWVLQGGAMVLADKGICLIDEFDKMNEHDRSSIHQAMQQQSISIAKAGIIAKLNARCSVISAANAIKGRYNGQLSFKDNVDLSEAIISRFDLLSVIKDQFNEQIDEKMATFVLNSHMSNHPIARRLKQTQNHEQYNEIFESAKLTESSMTQEKKKEDFITQQQIKDYLSYAREYCRPKVGNIEKQKVQVFYSKLRQVSFQTGGVGIVVRHIQSILRIAEAYAKIFLKKEIRQRDIDVGIRMILQSIIQTQKHSSATTIRRAMKQFMEIPI